MSNENSSYQASASGSIYQGFKPYRGHDVSADYKRVDIPKLGSVWARLADNGEAIEKRTVRDNYGTTIHIQPRWVILVLGWGAFGGEHPLFYFDLPKEDFKRLLTELADVCEVRAGGEPDAD